MEKLRILAIVFSLVLLGACSVSTKPAPTNPPVAPLSSAPPPVPTVAQSLATMTAPVPLDHQIAVRVVNGIGEFYVRQTGDKFVPRGMNYVRLADQKKMDGSSTFGHSLFDPGKYDSARVNADLKKMHSDGYNVIRVFLSPDTLSTSDELSPAYMRNVADLLQLAKQNQIYVMFTMDWIPGGKYGEILSADCCTNFTTMNANYLPNAGLKANQAFYRDFIQELIVLGAPIEYIFSYQLRNELFYDTDQPPLSFSSGPIKTANGKTYDMSNPADKDLMVKENLVYWIDEMRTAILETDPTALVSVGFFIPQQPNPARIGDTRLAVTEPAIWQSSADFIDLHAYPGFELNLQQHVENFGINGMQEKPIIMGEFGGEVSHFASVDSAAQRLVDWQVESCNYGYDGWIFWTWDLDEQPDFLNARMDGGKIEKALSPVLRPDPCVTGSGFRINLAAGKQITASNSLADQPPANANDKAPETEWNSGAGPQQWIEIDLGIPSSISTFRLTIFQHLEGTTLHQIWTGGPDRVMSLIHEFSGNTSDSQILEFTPDTPLTGVQFVRIVTVSGSSWVAWREIEVISDK